MADASSASTGPTAIPEVSDAAGGAATGGAGAKDKEALIVKVAIVGDAGIGKTSLMVRYVERRFDEDYVETLGVNFLEKQIATESADVTMSLWDLGGDKAYTSMLPITCVDAVAVLFCFDLTQRSSLTSIREWYRQVRGLNHHALPFLVGTKFDSFYALDKAEQEDITTQARKYAKAMHAPLIFCSAAAGINVLKLFKLVFEKVFSIEPDVEQKHEIGEPILEY
jgi:GTP-binding protein of the ras superfamily involved in termination of M-phase